MTQAPGSRPSQGFEGIQVPQSGQGGPSGSSHTQGSIQLPGSGETIPMQVLPSPTKGALDSPDKAVAKKINDSFQGSGDLHSVEHVFTEDIPALTRTFEDLKKKPIEERALGDRNVQLGENDERVSQLVSERAGTVDLDKTMRPNELFIPEKSIGTLNLREEQMEPTLQVTGDLDSWGDFSDLALGDSASSVASKIVVSDTPTKATSGIYNGTQATFVLSDHINPNDFIDNTVGIRIKGDQVEVKEFRDTKDLQKGEFDALFNFKTNESALPVNHLMTHEQRNRLVGAIQNYRSVNNLPNTPIIFFGLSAQGWQSFKNNLSVSISKLTEEIKGIKEPKLEKKGKDAATAKSNFPILERKKETRERPAADVPAVDDRLRKKEIRMIEETADKLAAAQRDERKKEALATEKREIHIEEDDLKASERRRQSNK